MVIDYTVLFITLIVMFLMTLLLVGAIYSRLHWVAKAIMIAASLFVAAAMYETFQGALGWPVGDAMPKKFKFISVVVVEPTREPATPGAIYLWYKDPNHVEPRSIKLPYSRPMHEQMAQAQKKAEQGRGGVYMEKKGTKKKSDKPQASDNQVEEVEIPDFVPPPSTMPEKDADPEE